MAYNVPASSIDRAIVRATTECRFTGRVFSNYTIPIDGYATYHWSGSGVNNHSCSGYISLIVLGDNKVSRN